MQQRPPSNLASLRRRNNPNARNSGGARVAALLAFLVLTSLPGCGGDPDPRPAAKAAPFAGATLKLRCPDPRFAAAATQAARSWATRTGATVTIAAEPMAAGDDADVGVIAVGELGFWADRDELAAVPASLRAADHPFQWTAVLPAYRERLIEWGGQARAVPLAGEGLVIVYRADRLSEANLAAAFRKRAIGQPGAPTSWEEFEALAAAFAEVDGRPSLTAMAPPEVADLFFRVAACYDRQPLSDNAIAQLGGAAQLSFQHDGQTGEPRLGAPGFAAAAEWLSKLTAGKSLATDPAAGLANDKAMIGVLSLAQLAKLRGPGGEIPPRYGLAALPGTLRYTEATSGRLVPGVNYVPYYGGGRLGVVRTRCKHPEAAFDLLAELGGPTRSQELVSDPALGVGPFRSTHLEQDRLALWLGYGLDSARSKALQAALQQNTRTEVRNPAYALRGPDQKELDAAAAEHLTRIASGAVPPDVGLRQLREAWERIDQKTPADKRLRWRKLAAGTN